MNFIYYFAGLLSGISVATFFIGKELHHYYVKNKVQRKQLDRMLKLNDKMHKSKVFVSTENSKLNVEA
ncbi:hypothetical protein [Flavobacterium sp. DSR3-2]|uniref:hypothetical protein n=1 Tax=Flavobacterium sp. DSR3-2 TaxID=2804634 RepID=UPI003CFBA1F0